MKRKINNNMAAKSEQIYDYVFHNASTRSCNAKSGTYSAHINICGFTYNERAHSDIEARAKLANELSKSKYIQNNFKQ